MHTDVAIFSTAAVSGALRVNCDVVERTEVTPHAANLLTEDLVVEAGFELSLTSASRGDIHSSLSTTENYVVLDGSNGGTVERGIGNVGLEHFDAVGSGDLISKSDLERTNQEFERPLGGTEPDDVRGSRLTLAVLSFEAVMKYVRSWDHCRSVTNRVSSFQ